jgi:3-methylfumaryl-CoA hydratase
MSGVLARSLAGWQPETAEMTRRVDSWPAEVFAGLTGVPLPSLEPGAPLPPLWHWFTLIDHPAQSGIGTDGHPADGPLLPPIPGRRRMFAGGRLEVNTPVPIGAELTSRSAVTGVSVKTGRSGEMAFVTVRNELSVDGAAVGAEEQDIVYRSQPEGEAPRAVPRPPVGRPEPAGEWRLELATGPVLLFRFSALTGNAHRIHYDWPYATGTEGYPGLVIHGPLLALLALELPRVHAPGRQLRAFSYRLVNPAFAPARLVAAAVPHADDDSVAVSVAGAGADPSLTGKLTFG